MAVEKLVLEATYAVKSGRVGVRASPWLLESQVCDGRAVINDRILFSS